jgi:dTMP kinase
MNQGNEDTASGVMGQMTRSHFLQERCKPNLPTKHHPIASNSLSCPAMSTDTQWIQQLRGRFIVFDGPDGSGKTTQFRRVIDLAKASDIAVCEVREPGGTFIGEQIRKILLDPENTEEVDVYCEMLLFMASRAQLISQKIRPALAAGQLVLADRFISSTLAYQGTAGGLPIDDIMRVGQIALRDCWPDLTVVFDVDQKTASTRLNPLLDRMEQKGEAYHRTVRQGYLDQVKNNPEGYALIDATASANEVFEELGAALAEKFGS